MISVLLVDDSGFMRMALRKMIEHDPGIEIVAEATSGEDAVRLALQHRPNVITMDIEMPGQCGLEATQTIMEQCPTAIIMLSSLTTSSAQATMKALSYGAVDYISKVSSFVDLDIVSIEAELLKKIHYWAMHWPAIALKSINKSVKANTINKQEAVQNSARWPKGTPDLLVIGASTGGPKIIPQLFQTIGKLKCPVVIALHMPPLYTESFAGHLGEMTGHDAIEGYDGMELEAGKVVVAPGGVDSVITKGRNESGRFSLNVRKAETYTIHPSVDELFISVAKLANNAVGIILSGMGNDGLKGAEQFKKKRFPVLAQEEKSCLVYGMPRVVVEAGLATEVLTLSEMSEKISTWAQAV